MPQNTRIILQERIFCSLLIFLRPFVLKVCRHLSKLFDNMAKLKFKEDDEGNPTKEALGLYSKEGEYVDFNKSCDCSGQVM